MSLGDLQEKTLQPIVGTEEKKIKKKILVDKKYRRSKLGGWGPKWYFWGNSKKEHHGSENGRPEGKLTHGDATKPKRPRTFGKKGTGGRRWGGGSFRIQGPKNQCDEWGQGG